MPFIKYFLLNENNILLLYELYLGISKDINQDSKSFFYKYNFCLKLNILLKIIFYA